MFIYKKGISSQINADHIREIEHRRWKEGDQWHSKQIAYFKGKGDPVEIDDDSNMPLAFYPCAAEYEVVTAHFDDDKQKTWLSFVPVIAWVEILGGGIAPFTLEMEIPKDDVRQKWGIKKNDNNQIIVPYIGCHPSAESFREDCHADFLKSVKK